MALESISVDQSTTQLPQQPESTWSLLSARPPTAPAGVLPGVAMA